MKPGRRRLERNGFAQGRRGFVIAATANQNAGEIKMANHTQRIESQRLSRQVLRLRQPALRTEENTERAFRPSVSRGQFFGRAEFGFGSGKINIRCQQYVAECFARSREIGRERQGSLGCVPRLGKSFFGFGSATQPRSPQ